MSKNYSTSATFHSYNQQSKIRQIVQEEIYGFFSQIKDEIERKIKTIDDNINQLKNKINNLVNHTSDTNEKVQDQQIQLKSIEKEIQIVKQTKNQEMLELLNMSSRSRSFEKERSNLFRKSTSTMDLSKLLFGEDKEREKEKIILEKQSPRKKPESKPPLPKITHHTTDKEQKVENNENKSSENEVDENLSKNLNKNKNTFMRKKSEKKLQTFTIEEESVQQSLVNHNNE